MDLNAIIASWWKCLLIKYGHLKVSARFSLSFTRHSKAEPVWNFSWECSVGWHWCNWRLKKWKHPTIVENLKNLSTCFSKDKDKLCQLCVEKIFCIRLQLWKTLALSGPQQEPLCLWGSFEDTWLGWRPGRAGSWGRRGPPWGGPPSLGV